MSVRVLEELPSSEEVLNSLQPYVREWFRRKFKELSPPQRGAISLIKRNENVLISSPTGTGKTLAAFLGILDYLLEKAVKGKLEDKVYVVYVSPLRALGNDMKRNLLEPLEGISQVMREMGIEAQEIRIGIRSSDTPPSEKQKQLRKPPHILITTPESLAISLASTKFSEKLSGVEFVIVDEIHEMASSKRGTHLSLTLERLALKAGEFTRIGLSATIHPLETVAKFLVGKDRDVWIVDARFAKPIDLRVICPVEDIVNASADELNRAIYEKLAQLVKEHRSVIVFTNTRHSTEKVAFKLKQVLEKEGLGDKVEAHHSSLSREVRLEVEEKLKRGELKVVVTSTSLEMGIDIGHVDLVVLLSSPKSVSRLLQRVGRAGHRIDAVSKGRVIVVDRDDLMENTVLVKLALERKIDRVRIPRNPLDVLAQHIVALTIEHGEIELEKAFEITKRAYPYWELEWNDFISVIKYLAGEYNLEDEKVYAKLYWDKERNVLQRKRQARMIFMMNAGTIPDESKVKVYEAKSKRLLGHVEELFVQNLVPGDVFVLSGKTYKYLYSNGMKIFVEPAPSERPTVPAWFSEMLPLAYDSAREMAKFREKLPNMTEEELIREYYLEPHAAKALLEYVREQLSYVGVVPGDSTYLIEIWKEPERTNYIFHYLIGRRGIDALSRAYAYALGRITGTNVSVTVTDYGFMLTVPGDISLDPMQIVTAVTPENLRKLVEEAVERTELFKRRFRHSAQRSFMILKRYMGREKSPERLQLSAQHLIKVVREIKDFPVYKETLREILEDYMNIDAAEETVRRIHSGEVKIEVVGPLDVPSPFAHVIVANSYSDVVLMEDKRKLLQRLREMVLMKISSRSYEERVSYARGSMSGEDDSEGLYT
ncbi:helicase [Ignicoccus islandicus DSM 13165]|uniref:Helicase n=1 Tax=Ignicoccus islandicus DSM 13165 TaxID=940295 RepID=A0A0U3E0Y9_9CREN|nr:ATP-dependent helicase [Ignicoccus islandicus]ALU11579.1 helicase [Ignicoccus islandicus DSM 13165]